jgi:hypothetical protein
MLQLTQDSAFPFECLLNYGVLEQAEFENLHRYHFAGALPVGCLKNLGYASSLNVS